MIRRIRNCLVVIIVCLLGYMVYDMYQMREGELFPKESVFDTERFDTEGLDTEGFDTEGLDTVGFDAEEGKLPSRYDCRETGKAPSVKNQGELGTCWAVVASSVLESRLLPQEKIVFSADHISTQNGYTSNQQEGGAFMMSAAYLAAWKGPVTEEQDPYGDGISAVGVPAVKHVQEIQMLQERKDAKIKQLVHRYGAIQSSIYMDMGGRQVTSEYYDERKAAYCYTGDAEANHDVLIIGWDDDYPAENFTYPPDENGAFICQNSWGSDFGEDGIFYVAYADRRIGKNCAVCTRVEPADNYDHIYQSDLCGWVGQLGYGKDTCWFANVYTAGEAETLRAVGFYAVGENTDYEILVEKDYQNDLSLILADRIQEGSFENPGFYTVDLQTPVPLEAGEKFAVAVKIKTPDSKYPVAMEYRTEDTAESVILDDGDGYISADGYRWVGTETEYKGNICLKAYTDND